MDEMANSSNRKNNKNNKPSITLIIFGAIGALIGVGIGRLVLDIISGVARDAFKGLSPADIAYWITVSLGHYIPLLIGGGVVGLVCGLVPYFVGKKQSNNKLGKIALWSCITSGLISGIVLALPVAIIFSIIITVKKTTIPRTDSDDR